MKNTVLKCNVCGNESGGYEGDFCVCGEGMLMREEGKMEELEYALLDKTGQLMDTYLENTSTKDIIADIEALKMKAMISTEAGKMKAEIINLLNKYGG
jgi:hypothetical protein